ncbi:MAG: YcaO-like family protein, partial [Alphaproteobacteria bacterium]
VEFRRGDGRHAWRSLIHDGVAERRFQDVQTASHATFEEDILHVLECLAGVDIQSVCAVNLTKDEFDIPVVKILVPGLEGIVDSASYVYGARARAFVEA